MKLKEYLSQKRGATNDLARELGVSKSYVSQLARGVAPIHPNRAVQIETLTGGQVRRWDLIADWHKTWPELIGQPGAPEIIRRAAHG